MTYPGAFASMFWADPKLGSDIYFYGIIPVDDTKYELQHLREEKTVDLLMKLQERLH